MVRATRAMLPMVALVAGCAGGGAATIPPPPSVSSPPPVSNPPPAPGTWPVFGYDAARSDDAPAGIAAADVGRLRRVTVPLSGTVDSSPVFAGGLFVVTTSYGRTLAVRPDGTIAWRYDPPGIGAWEGTAQITNASPAVAGGTVYAASPDGRIHRLALATGRERTSGRWPALITRDPTHEKIGTALNLSGRYVLATTGGYIGDAPPYQGHVAAIDRRSGRVAHVWNTLCADRAGLLDPASCDDSGAAVWARSGAVVEPASGRILIATGNGRYDGETAFGDSVVELTPDASSRTGGWTPPNQADLAAGDIDLGSTAPALVRDGRRRMAVQGGKDGILRLIDLATMRSVQELPTPGGAGLFSAPAVAGRTVIVADDAGIAAYRLAGGRLAVAWRHDRAGTSPVVAGGLVYVFDPGGALAVYRLGSGAQVAVLPAEPGHWQSPIVVAGAIALGGGDANDHETAGDLQLYRAG